MELSHDSLLLDPTVIGTAISIGHLQPDRHAVSANLSSPLPLAQQHPCQCRHIIEEVAHRHSGLLLDLVAQVADLTVLPREISLVLLCVAEAVVSRTEVPRHTAHEVEEAMDVVILPVLAVEATTAAAEEALTAAVALVALAEEVEGQLVAAVEEEEAAA